MVGGSWLLVAKVFYLVKPVALGRQLGFIMNQLLVSNGSLSEQTRVWGMVPQKPTAETLAMLAPNPEIGVGRIKAVYLYQ
jgi:hypothetical protein